MKLYIVRHGQSEGNAQRIHQTRDSHLTDLGRQQAQFVAQRFETIEIDQLIASEYKRTQETGEIIANHLDLKIELSPLLIELKRPSQLEGKGIEDQSVETLRQKAFKKFWTEDHISDEENYFDLRDRVDRFIQTLEPKSDQNLLLVSHGVTIKMLVSRLIFGDLHNPDLFRAIIGSWRTQNTGLTFCEFKHDRWHLESWNDSAHLGEV